MEIETLFSVDGIIMSIDGCGQFAAALIKIYYPKSHILLKGFRIKSNGQYLAAHGMPW